MRTVYRMDVPNEQAEALRRAIRLEWISIGFTACTVALVATVLGNSQAMKTAWVEDILSVIPQFAFLLAVRVIGRSPTPKHPYGMHRATGVGHLVAGVALVIVGGSLMIDAGSGLLTGEHPSIGTIELFGNVIWLGWIMMGVMASIAAPPVVFGHLKMKLARTLHNKVLYADAAMNKADWMTNVGSIVGVGGIGLGLWWADSAAALFIAASITWDGVKNTKDAVLDLMDKRATTFDDSEPHPVSREVDDYLRELDWVLAVRSRVRDEGQVFHIEAFVVPRRRKVSLEQLEEARAGCSRIDWKVQDVVIVPVRRLPSEFSGAG
ncbi:cation transporter [Okibacterium endophyticum]